MPASADYTEKIPNNVDLREDRRLQRALEPAWQKVPGEYRADLRRLIVIQGDTEPASVEQQRNLGATGVDRVVERTVQLMREHDTDDVAAHGAIPLDIVQKYLNFHYSVSLDLFGSETSSNVANYYTAGLKGRWMEGRRKDDHVLTGDAVMVDALVDGAVGQAEVAARRVGPAQGRVAADRGRQDARQVADAARPRARQDRGLDRAAPRRRQRAAVRLRVRAAVAALAPADRFGHKSVAWPGEWRARCWPRRRRPGDHFGGGRRPDAGRTMTHAKPDQPNLGRNAILWGAAGDRLSGSDFPDLDGEFGPLTVRRSYQPAAVGMPTSWAASNAGVDVGERASCWSGKPSITAMARGALDRETLAFLRSIPKSHLAFVSIWHEADGKIRSGSFGLATYRTAFRRFCRLVQQVKDEGRPRLHTIQILTTWSGTSPRAGTTYADLWPGDDLVDCLGVDGYSHVGTRDSLWGPAVEFARSKGIPWAVPEIGYGRTGTRDVSWLNDQVEYLTTTAAGGRRTRCAFACWFDTAGPISVRTPGGNPAWVAAARSVSRRYHCDPDDFVL